MMSDNEFDDNVEGDIGAVEIETNNDTNTIGNKRTHTEIDKPLDKSRKEKNENDGSDNEEDSESSFDESDYELNETGEPKKKKNKKQRILPSNNISNFSRKDKTLQEILDFLEKQPPIIPDPIIDYYLKKNGLQLESSKLKKLISIATTKFISDIAIDTYEYSRIRSATAVYNANNSQQKAKQLLMGQQQQKLLQQELNNNSSSNAGSTANAADPSTIKSSADAANGANKGPTTQQQHNDKDKIVLRMSDLSSALKEYGLNIEKPDFYR
ncbi:hypothetical protein ACO0SA_004179 [Hanseniaspora valbyensis]